ncbi:TonB-dependent receptor [Blastomonas sp. UPD001]|uniref:TonB-dependent receptor domain-containing protein n=1 Tax=Blastomonas sp. UPD001 TaxID=2217673 RepID=UPI00336BEAC5
MTVTDFRQADAWESFDWRAGLRYHVNDDVMLYASYSSGYKSGGFNIGGTQPSYRPETVDSYEGGLKSTFLDKRLRFNLTGFYNDYKNKQENKIETVQAQLVNAARARVYGLEMEMQLRPSNALTVDANLTYLNARYRDFLTSDPLNITAGNVQLRGNQLTYSPTWKFGVGAQYEFELGSSGEIMVRGDLSCVDDQTITPFNRQDEGLDSYCRGNVRAGWHSDDSRYSFEIFANNIGDVNIIESRLLTATILGPNYNSLVQSPRVYGIRLGVEF